MIEEKLRRSNKPFGLTPETYILAKVGLFILSLIYIYIVGMEGIQAVLFAILVFLH